jgi:hypothetical protein
VSKKSSILYLAVIACAVFTAVTVAAADFGAFAQNTNSSTTEDPSMTQNTNDSAAPAPRRRRRGRRRAARPAAAADAGMAADDTSSTAGDTQTDLSGTYTGKLKMTGSHEMEGDGTITISGNNVTIESGGMTHTGRIFAVTTRGYTGVTMAFADIQDTATNTNLVVMARARKRGDRLQLTPVPGARNVIAFR